MAYWEPEGYHQMGRKVNTPILLRADVLARML